MIFNDVLENVKLYEAGKPIELLVRQYGIKENDIIKLASNENPYGTSLVVQNKIKSIVQNMFRYPDDSMYELKKSLSLKFNVNDDNIIIGCGSDQVLDFCVKAKCAYSSNVIMSNTTFAMYEIYSNQVGANILKTKDDLHNLEQFKMLYKKYGADIIFLCLPNNPLGECLNRSDVYDFLDEIDDNTLVIVDGAYQEYASFKDNSKKIDPYDLISKYNNTIYLGTFSKAYGLGGMRIGYGIACENIINSLLKLRPPFNITNLSLQAAIEVLKDQSFVDDCISKNFVQMKRYEDYVIDKGFCFIDSYTNFITIKFDDTIKSCYIFKKLLENGIIVRNLKSYGINAIRVTIGRDFENTKFFNVLDNILLKISSKL